MTTPSNPETFSAGLVPAVDDPTNLAVAPVVHAGQGAAPDGLVGADLVVGTGPPARPGATVQVHYVGTLFSTGAVFDSSWKRGPVSFSLDQVIPGFSQGIAGMKIGGRRVLVIPAHLGYGDAGAPPVIPGGATLVFVIDLLAIY